MTKSDKLKEEVTKDGDVQKTITSSKKMIALMN